MRSGIHGAGGEIERMTWFIAAGIGLVAYCALQYRLWRKANGR